MGRCILTSFIGMKAFSFRPGFVNSEDFELDRFSMMLDLIHLLSLAEKTANELRTGYFLVNGEWTKGLLLLDTSRKTSTNVFESSK